MMHRIRSLTTAALLLVFCSALAAAAAQTPQAPQAPQVPQAPAAPDAPPPDPTDHAWSILTGALNPTSSMHVEQRIQALAALGSMGSTSRSTHMIATALTDRDLDIRTAAVLAAGQTKDPFLISELHKTLDDPEPSVAYTAAITLWKMHDHSGEDLLMAVAHGDRRASASLLKNARHSAARTLHSTSAMGKLGVEQGGGRLLGPFGLGITAVEYARGNGGDSLRAGAIELLGEQHTAPVREELAAALLDKDPALRVAAAKALGLWPGPETAKLLVPLLDDTKLPVRLTAAASFLRASNPPPPPPAATVPPPAPSRHPLPKHKKPATS
jgi:HEAT repeat protein